MLTPLIQKAYRNLNFATAPNLQRAVAAGLAKNEVYFAALANSLAGSAGPVGDRAGAGRLSVLPIGGTYVITTDFSSLGFDGGDVAF